MSARRVWRGPVGDPGVHDRDSGVGRGALLGQQERQRATERRAAAEDHDVATGDRDAVVGEQLLDARRCARPRAGQADGEAAHVDRVHAVDVLVRVDGEQRGVVVEVAGHGVLHQQRVHGPVGRERRDRLDQLLLRRVVGQVHVRRVEAQLGGPALLEPDVAGAGVVVADQDGGEARHDAVLAEWRPRSATSARTDSATGFPGKRRAMASFCRSRAHRTGMREAAEVESGRRFTIAGASSQILG